MYVLWMAIAFLTTMYALRQGRERVRELLEDGGPAAVIILVGVVVVATLCGPLTVLAELLWVIIRRVIRD